MATETRLLLARHAESVRNAAGRWEGRSDSPLTVRGRVQAGELAARVRNGGLVHAVYSSPLGRALATARMVAAAAGGPSPLPQPELVELDLGAWDGLAPDDPAAGDLWEAVERDPRFAPPGGESFAWAATRVVAALLGIAAAHAGRRVAVVSHGIALAGGLALLLKGDAALAPRYLLPNAGLAELGMSSAPRLVSIDPVIACDGAPAWAGP